MPGALPAKLLVWPLVILRTMIIHDYDDCECFFPFINFVTGISAFIAVTVPSVEIVAVVISEHCFCFSYGYETSCQSVWLPPCECFLKATIGGSMAAIGPRALCLGFRGSELEACASAFES